MRRGEVLRLRWSDVEFDQGHISARSRKQSRRTVETKRRIDLHPELKTELLAWRQRRPGGQYVVCEVDSLEALNPDRANRAFWRPLPRAFSGNRGRPSKDDSRASSQETAIGNVLLDHAPSVLESSTGLDDQDKYPETGGAPTA